MSSFTDRLGVDYLGGGMWETSRSFVYWTDCDDDDGRPPHELCRVSYTVPQGTVTDFASIPQIFWSLIGHPAGEYAQAAVLHDWLYRARIVPRREADRIFLEAMGVLGVASWKARLMWAAVRIGGGAAYRGHP